MNNLKNKFSIKDLENLTGVKAHTIRIWEKRYNLLSPKRTDTNIRYYDLASFQKMLNVSYLNNNGLKISKIATLEDREISDLVRDIATENNIENHAINAFKLSMLNFDQTLFYKTYSSLLREKSFQDVFYEIFIPLLTEIGLLWQTNTITPAHEHFLTSLIRQKILINTEYIQAEAKPKSKKTFVLYLPDNEIHELGLMFLNYIIISKNYNCIFLGQSVPLDNLTDILHYYDDLIYLSYFTIKPEKLEIDNYINTFEKTILQKSNSELWILGQMLNYIDLENLPNKITAFKSIQEIVAQL